MIAKVSFQGTRFRKDLKEAGDKAVRAVASAVYELGNEIMIDAKQRAPVDTGAMRGSGYVTEPEVTSSKLTVELGFGGPAKSYVVEQHENLAIFHKVGEAKFLEKAFDAASPNAGKQIAAKVRQHLGIGEWKPGKSLPSRPS